MDDLLSKLENEIKQAKDDLDLLIEFKNKIKSNTELIRLRDNLKDLTLKLERATESFEKKIKSIEKKSND